MYSPFISGPKELLRAWRELRGSLNCDLKDQQQVDLVLKFWSKAPISKYHIDWDNPQDWPDAWNLINGCEFDESSVSLAMFYTLLLAEDSRWNPERLQLVLVRDAERQIQRLVLEIDQKWILNLDYNTIVEKDEKNQSTLMIQQKYEFDGKKHHEKDSNIHRNIQPSLANFAE